MIYSRINGRYNIHASAVDENVILDEVATLLKLVIRDLSVSLEVDTGSVAEKAIVLIQEGLIS